MMTKNVSSHLTLSHRQISCCCRCRCCCTADDPALVEPDSWSERFAQRLLIGWDRPKLSLTPKKMQRELWTRTNNELICAQGANGVAPISHLLFFFFGGALPSAHTSPLTDADSWLLLSYITCIHADWHMNAGVGGEGGQLWVGACWRGGGRLVLCASLFLCSRRPLSECRLPNQRAASHN